MIYVTGDMHGDKDRYKTQNIKKLKKDDSLFICGDFGFVWEDSKKEKKILKWISKRKFLTLFVDGAHENFELLESYPEVDFMGGKARQLGKNLYHLKRGEIFVIEEKKFFVFGGGEKTNTDNYIGKGGVLKEQPSEQEIENARKNLDKHSWSVDYVITHDITSQIKSFLDIKQANFNTLEFFLKEVSEKCKFRRWFFGHSHIDKVVSPLYTAVFKNIIALDK